MIGAKGRLLSLLGVAISVGILVYLFSQLNLADFYKELTHVRIEILPWLIILMILSNICRALRWRILLPSKNHIKTYSLFEGIIVGYTATYLLPLRAGEFVRAFYISKIEDVSFSGAFGSIVTERVFDVLIVLALLGCCFGFMPSVPAIVSLGAKSLALLALVISGIMILAYKLPRMITSMAYRSTCIITRKRYSALSRKVVGMAREFIQGLQSLSGLKDLFLVLFYSAGTWFFYCVFYWFSLNALGQPGSLLLGGVVTVIIAFAIAAPSAPGFLGTYQAGCVIALTTIYGMSQSFSVAYSIVTHVIQATFIILLGLYFLTRRGLKLTQLTSS